MPSSYPSPDYPRWYFYAALFVAALCVILAVMCWVHRQESDIVTVDFEGQVRSNEISLPGEPDVPELTTVLTPIDSILDAGRKVYYGEATNYPDTDAAYRYYLTFKIQTWVRLRGFPYSPLCYEEIASHFVNVCLDAGREPEMAIAICEMESTLMLASGGNDMGICDSRFQPGTIEDYVDYLYYYQCVNPGAMGYRGGFSNEPIDIYTVFNDHQAWRDNVTALYEGIRGERY